MRLISQAVLVVAIIAAFSGGLFFIVRDSDSGRRIEILLPTPTVAPDAELKVHISGAVRSPGVYAVADGDRLEDVVVAAGGKTEEADLSAVNLAVRVKDEDRWHIPVHGEELRAPVSEANISAPCAAAAGKVDLNSADAEALMALDGIGETLAQRIVGYRDANGPFSNVDELDEVRGIGPTILSNNRESMVVCP